MADDQKNKTETGKVSGNFDVDNRSSGYGRGSDDSFTPDSDKAEKRTPSREPDQKDMKAELH